MIDDSQITQTQTKNDNISTLIKEAHQEEEALEQFLKQVYSLDSENIQSRFDEISDGGRYPKVP
jgi:nitrate reductase assembly molybdenum cofactor insertion protein NarJ